MSVQYPFFVLHTESSASCNKTCKNLIIPKYAKKQKMVQICIVLLHSFKDYINLKSSQKKPQRFLPPTPSQCWNIATVNYQGFKCQFVTQFSLGEWVPCLPVMQKEDLAHTSNKHRKCTSGMLVRIYLASQLLGFIFTTHLKGCTA